jgi:hypothetical protein
MRHADMRYGHVQIFHQSISMNVGTCSLLQLAAVTTGQTERVMWCVLQLFRHGTICHLQQTLCHTLYLILYFKLHSENTPMYSTNQYFTRPAGDA